MIFAQQVNTNPICGRIRKDIHLKMFLKVTLLMMFINLISVIDLFVDFILVFCWINKLNLLNF